MTSHHQSHTGIRIVLILVFCVLASVRAQNMASRATSLLGASGIKGGLLVHVGCGNGQLAAALRQGSQYLVHGLERSPEPIAAGRSRLFSAGTYGPVSLDVWDGNRLPYTDGLINLLVVSDPSFRDRAEMLRVLAPRGVALVCPPNAPEAPAERWERVVKPLPDNTDEWTHYLHSASNNAVAQDEVVGPPKHLQWLGSPRWSRHHDNMASVSALVSAQGRIIYVLDEGSTASVLLPSDWKLVARDAYNGTILWKRNIAHWHTRLWPLKSGPAYLPRRLVANNDVVYVTLGLDAPLTALDAPTGETLRTYQGTELTDEILHHNGVLYLVQNAESAGRDGVKANVNAVGDIRKEARSRGWGEEKRFVMAVRASSGEVLWKQETTVLPITLAANDRLVCFHDGSKLVALAPSSGKQLWSSQPVARSRKLQSFFAPTLVLHDNVVLFSGGSVKPNSNGGGNNTMIALSATTGKKLWEAPHPHSGYKSPEDIFVVDGLVWFGATVSGGVDGVHRGYDPVTGELKREFAPDVETYWFHHRCHRGKATEKYLLTSRTGIEFLDVRKQTWDINHWIRGGCLYGIMPANGMIYTPPHDCACYSESKQFGFNAVRAASPSLDVPATLNEEQRLQRGPAYGWERAADTAADWPTFRAGNNRFGTTAAKVETALKEAWKTKLAGKLSAVTVAQGKLYVASVDMHTVHCLDGATGKAVWRFTAGGRVDSPPTFHRGLLLFGSADGFVYALRNTDGELVWRYRAAPTERRIMSFEQLESTWPVHGSVLVENNALYCVAGRSMFLDAGMRWLKLNPLTGKKLAEIVLDDRDPEDPDQDLHAHVKTLNMPVALSDILASDGKSIFMRSQRFDHAGKRYRVAPLSADMTRQGMAQASGPPHLFSSNGFLDGTWFHRSYWTYGSVYSSGWYGYHEGGKFAPAGRILSVDGTSVYGFGRKPQYYRWTTQLEYHLFKSSRKLPEPKLPTDKKQLTKGFVSVAKSDSENPAGKALTLSAWVKAKGDGVIAARGGPYQGFALYLNESKPVFALRRDKQLYEAAAETPLANTWTHVAGILAKDGTITLYVNGSKQAQEKAPGVLSANPAQAMEIGADDGGNVGNYTSPAVLNGALDDVRLYLRALAPDEVAAFAKADTPPTAEDETLVLYHIYDAGKAQDQSDHGNDGVIGGGINSVKGKYGNAIELGGKGKATRRRRPKRGIYSVTHDWSVSIPILVRGLVLTGDALFVAGPPDVLDEEEAMKRFAEPEIQELLKSQEAAMTGAQGGRLLAVSKADGAVISQIELDTFPVWDGLCATQGRLYMSALDGTVRCFSAKQ